MPRSIGSKIVLAASLTTLVLVGGAVGLVRLELASGFSHYLERSSLEPLARRVERAYPWHHLPALEPQVGLLDANDSLLAGPPAAATSTFRIPLRRRGRLVGYLALIRTPEQRAFLAGQTGGLWLISLLVLVLGTLAGALLARRLRSPITRLVEGTRRLARGDYQARIELERNDELGELAANFNQLAHALGRHEASRRQWVADTSHELRTPIAVLRAELEALMDGVRKPDRRTLEALCGQVLSLSKLVDDLGELTRADVGQLQYHMATLDPGAVLLEVVEVFRKRYAAAGLKVHLPRTTHLVAVRGDADRLRQLFGNLFENTLRYTDRGGQLELSVLRSGKNVVIAFEDSAPGVPAEALEHLFERFFRVDQGRGRERGGSGLGLALCRRIVEAHGGSVGASPSRLGGLRIEILLPQAGVLA